MAGLFTPNSGSGGGYGTIGAGKGQLGEIGHPLLQSGRQMRTMQNAATARNRGFERAETTYGGVRDEYKPYMELGRESVSAVQKLFGDPGSVKGLPGYQFRLEQGQGAIENVAGAKGKLFSGNTLQELVRYGQDYATSEYDKELARRMGGVKVGMDAATGYDKASLNLAEIQAGRGQAAARQFEDQSKYLAGFEQAGRDMFGSWFGGSGPFGQATGASMGSDRSIKENIVQVGTHISGAGIYTFEYQQQYKDTWGHGSHTGVMADEVETIMPEAVTIHPDGYKMVNYSMLEEI